MAKLVKIIMIHGHMPGVVELDLDGHTNICGSNASGKTTLQRMIPVFYGELPNRVVPRTRQSFERYYLPHKNSYVIYEYQRPRNGLAQVVLSKRAEGVDYRFVDAPYQPEHYLLEDKEQKVVAREYQDWAQYMRQNGIDISAKISNTTEYRNIILNDIKNDRSSRSDSLRHRQLASRYALAPDSFSLRHIEKLVSAVHAKEGKMDTLKSMLAAILEEDGYQRPANAMTGDKIRSWLRDMKQFMKMDALHQSLAAIEQLSGEHAQNLVTLRRLKSLLEQDYSQQRQYKADAEQAIQAHRRADDEAAESYRMRRSELVDTKNDASSVLKNSQEHLDNAQLKYDAYRDAEIDRIGHELDRLPERRTEQQNLEQHYKVMMEAHQGAEQELQQHKLQLSEQTQRSIANIQTQINQKNAEQQRVHQDELDATKTMAQQLQHEQNQVRTQYETELTQVRAELAGKRAQVGLSMLNAHELEQKTQVDMRLDNAQERLDMHMSQLARQEAALSGAEQQREQAANQLKEARSLAAQGELLIEQLRQRLEPSAGSLRQFLAQNVEHWQHSFGRVLAEPLLQRTDLTPELKAEQDTIFGVQLDLHALEIPEHALTEERLQEQLAQAVEQWQRQKQQLDTAEKALANAVEHVKQQQDALQLAQQEQRRLESDVSYARDHRQRLIAEHAQIDSARKQAISQQIEQLQEQVAQLEQRCQAALAEVESEHQSRALDLTAEFQEQRHLLQDAIDDLDNERVRIQASTQERYRELDEAFNARLAEQGVDEQQLRQLKEQISSTQAHIREIESQRSAYNDYQQFMQVTWTKLRPQWLADEQQAKQQLREASSALERHEAEYKALQQSRRAQFAQLKEQLATAEKYVQDLKGLVTRMEAVPMSLEPAQAHAGLEQGDVSERIARAYELFDNKHRLDKSLEDGINSLEADIRKDSDLEFVRFMEESFAKLEPAPDMLARVHVLRDIIDVLEGKQQQTIGQGKTIGTALFKFFTVFNDIHKRVSDYSRRLTQAVGDELTLEGIDKAEVKISSTIDELSFWQPLKDMTYHFRQWQSSGEPLPPGEYLEHLSDVADLLKANQEYSIESLLKLQLNLVENGEPVVIRNDRQLTDSSSNGMAYLILCKFLLAFTRLLRPDAAGVTIHWPVDELGTLAYHNVEKLFEACDHNTIYILGAFPNAESEVLQLFKHKYLIEPHAQQPTKGQLKRIKPRISAITQKIQELQRNAQTQEAQA